MSTILNYIVQRLYIIPGILIGLSVHELGHAKDRWRWTWAQGGKAKSKLEAAGFKAVVPLWGDRIS